MTLDKELLTAKGTIDALTSLTTDDPWTVSELADEMDVANTTARNRVGQLRDSGLVEEDADLRDGRAVRVFELTSEGVETANALLSILDGASTDASDAYDDHEGDDTDEE